MNKKEPRADGHIDVENHGAVLVARIDGGPHALFDAAGVPPLGRSGRIESLTARCRARRTIRAMGRARRRHTPEQIIRKLREADRLLGEGQEVSVVAKQLEVSEQTLHRWRLQYGGLKADDAKRLKELEKENSRLKQIVADQLLENQALKEIARGNF